MLTDPLADLLTRIRNANLMRHEQVTIPYSKLKEAVVKILVQEAFVRSYEVVGEKTKKSLAVSLKYSASGEPTITMLRKMSRPGRRLFSGCEEMKPYRDGMGLKIISTSKGVLSDNEARKLKVGGEILVEVW